MTLPGKLVKSVVVLILACCCGIANAQQPKPGLLWRISGNGLQQPSYLFGTIHLTDKRVFNFGDSLYSALEASAGYAMELNPDSLMFYYFNDEKDNKPSPLLKDVVSPEKFAAAKKKLQKEFGKPAEKITVKELKTFFNEWVYVGKEQSMQSFMDAFLYNIVRRQGKWVGGIEDVQDQTDLEDEEGDLQTARYYVNDFINNYRDSKRTLEEMIRRYTANDLSLIEEMSESGSDFQRQVVLLRRNFKMASRIDSLAKIRNTFFAIGSAHLPGDSGVISLLRTRGYTLTPVISSRLIHADNYKFQLKELPWVKVESSTGLYTVDMPGEPQNKLLELDNMDFKMYADVPTNLYYFTMGIIGKPISNVDSLLRALVNNIDKKAVISGMKHITQDSIEGTECFAKSERVFYQIRMFHKGSAFYLAMVGSLNVGNRLPAEADRFFRSFVMNPHPAEIPKGPNRIERKEFGFAINFPMKPTLKNAVSDEDGWITTHYSGIDFLRDIFYQFLIKDIQKGYFSNGDSSAFDQYKGKFSEEHKLLSFNTMKIQQYPAVRAEFEVEAGGVKYYNNVLNLHRGNRMYVLVVTTSQKEQNKNAIDSFFNSFQLMPLQNPKWEMQLSPDKTFSTWGCSPIELFRSNGDTTGEVPYWTVYDSLAPVTFFVKKESYPKYFWAKDDTSLLRSGAKTLLGYGDSLISYKLVHNGKSRGAEALVSMYDNHNLKKVRLILVGDSLYSLFAIAPAEFLDKSDYKRFFEDFRTTRDTAVSTLFISKRKELLSALHSTDSTLLAEANSALATVDFDKEDLPDLHQAMLDIYNDTTYTYNFSRALTDIVAGIDDPGSIEVVRREYPKLPKEKEELKYYLLSLLAGSKKETAHMLLGDLLVKGLPTEGAPYELFNELLDSLQLARRYYPLLLKYLGDSVAGRDVFDLTQKLVDSNLIDKKMLVDNKQAFFDEVASVISRAKSYPYYRAWYDGRTLINLLGRMETAEANALLKKLSVQKNMDLKYYAVSALLKNKQAVDPLIINQIASNFKWRIELYEDLKRSKKELLFPKQYYSQQYFAEATLYNYAMDEGEATKFTYLGERTTMFESVKSRFLLFKVEFDYDGEKQRFLGIVGPYQPGSKKVELEASGSGIYFEEEFDSTKVNTHFKSYLKQFEEEMRK